MASYKATAEWQFLVSLVKSTEESCHLCHALVNVHLPAGLDESPEIDHIIPTSRGGPALDRENLRLSHKLCNQKKGNKMMEELVGINFIKPLAKEVVRVKRKRKWLE